MLEEFRGVAETLTFHQPAIPVISNLTGRVADRLAEPGYWVEQIRGTVRFADTLACLDDLNTTAYLELGPDATLSVLAERQLEGPTAVAALRREHREPETFATALATLYAHGTRLRWPSAHGHTGLPTYPFQHRRFWLSTPGAGDLGAAGLAHADHPLLGAEIDVADGRLRVLTGMLSARTHPWLADHGVADTALLPGAVFLELARHAGQRAGVPHVDALTVRRPLALPERGVQLQITVGPPDHTGHRAVDIYSRPAADEADDADARAWTHHATGALALPTSTASPEPTSWPPPGATPVPVDELYQSLADAGYRYGPTFQGVRAAWTAGQDLYAEIGLPDGTDVTGFGVHPALLDAALHPALHHPAPSGDADPPRLASSWAGVTLHATGATSLRVHLTPVDDVTLAVAATDPAGAPVITIDSVTVHPVRPDGPVATSAARHLYLPAWVAVSATATDAASAGLAVLELDAGADLDAVATAAPIPRAVLLRCPAPVGDQPEATHHAAREVLRLAQNWLADERLAGSRLVVITRGAVATHAGEHIEALAHAAVWGLLRSAQNENPGRFVLVDTDGTEASVAALPAALTYDEPQMALRRGAAYAPRPDTTPGWSHRRTPTPGGWRPPVVRPRTTWPWSRTWRRRPRWPPGRSVSRCARRAWTRATRPPRATRSQGARSSAARVPASSSRRRPTSPPRGSATA